MVAATTHVPLAGSYLQLVEASPADWDSSHFRTSTPDRSSPTESMDRIRHQRPRTGLFRVLEIRARRRESGQQSGDTAAEPSPPKTSSPTDTADDAELTEFRPARTAANVLNHS